MDHRFFGRYKELKAKGKITLQLVGMQVITISKRYDSATSEELGDIPMPADEESLARQKAELEAEVEGITEYLADIGSAKK